MLLRYPFSILALKASLLNQVNKDTYSGKNTFEIQPKSDHNSKGAGSFHIHRKTMKDLWALAVLGVREQPNLAQDLVTHSQ